MQKWEYFTIFSTRVWQGRLVPQISLHAEPWNNAITEDYLSKLGEEGWELVAIVPSSGYAGTAAGFTSEETWVFKRPKP
jgi:hypothetical protein